ncbi:ap-1 complex subunit beta-1 isoform x3 [Stylonychia lemnae]|uniref:AP complex subunit beta n=1 Tax=Stylonychia lemnae TaxID=5949 RepID=A0A077ZR32_STYLE|nr:ap-1 complex subunit beta-1 isoform x3 [Stylonychia lemnae]|eukprot:CDW71914.1 ap-1 complex subunit beta-1 isoform x3 [Stylonychia lemnae]
MTVGKDVSKLFFPVLKCVETQSLELKKLVYLYIINYAKTQPDLAVLAVNSFRKDARERINPLIRGLAIRTMGCIGVEAMLDYMCEPLKESLEDPDPYVRKTAAICVAKLYEVSPQRFEDFKFLQQMRKLLTTDGNGMVVSNTVASLSDIQSAMGGVPPIEMTQEILNNLLNAITECSEWGKVYILDYLANNMINNPKDVDEIIQRVIPNLVLQNVAVVLSAAKVIIKYLDFVNDTEKIRSICRKMAPPLISLMNNDPEVQYIAVRNINLIIQKRPYIIDKEVRVFFCNFQDPLYVKLEKLEIMIKLADLKNVDSLLNELKDYAQEIDVVFVRKSISAVGRIAIKLERAADRCIQVLHQLINTKIDYVVQEAIIVIKDIFRKYPNKYESIIKDLCENLKALDNTDARASMIWIIGEYGERIDNAIDLMLNFSENFRDEAKKVQLAILNASVKLYLKLESQAEDLVQDVLKLATDESDNPDLRNRGYIYWRMLSTNPELAKRIILSQKPTISEDSSTIEPQLLDKLIDNVGMLSSIYYKPPEAFVKKIRDKINERLDLENEDDGAGNGPKSKDQEDYIDSQGVKRSEYLQEQPGQQQQYSNFQDLLGVEDNSNTGTGAIDDLLGGLSTPTQPQVNSQPLSSITDLDDLLGGGSTQINTNTNSNMGSGGNYVSDSLLDLDLGGGIQTVLNSQKPGAMNNQVGFQVEAAFQRENDNLVLELKLTNHSQQVLSDFLMKINTNYYGVNVVHPFPSDLTVSPGETKFVKLSCATMINNGQTAPAKPPILIQSGIKCNLDLFYFDIPMLSQVLFTRQSGGMNTSQLQMMWESIPSQPDNYFTVASMSPQVSNAHAMISRLQDNGVYFMNQGTNENGFDALYVYAVPVKQDEVVVGEISISSTGVVLQARSPAKHMVLLFLQSMNFLLCSNA